MKQTKRFRVDNKIQSKNCIMEKKNDLQPSALEPKWWAFPLVVLELFSLSDDYKS